MKDSPETARFRPRDTRTRPPGLLPRLLTLSVLLLAPTAEAGEVRRIERSFGVEGVDVLRLEAPVGDFRFERGGTSVRVDVVLGCAGDYRACRTAAEGVRLTSRSEDGVRVIELENPDLEEWWRYGKLKKGGWEMTVEAVVRYPEVGRLEVDLGTGVVDLRTLYIDAGIHVDHGRVKLAVSRARTGSVELSASRGRVVFVDPQGREIVDSSNPFREKPGRVRWTDGDGPLDLEVQVGRGDVLVQLLSGPW